VKEVAFVTAKCKHCGKSDTSIVQAEPYDRWLGGGADVQDVFPRLGADEREVLIGSRKGYYVCWRCWEEVLGGDDDEDDT